MSQGAGAGRHKKDLKTQVLTAGPLPQELTEERVRLRSIREKKVSVLRFCKLQQLLFLRCSNDPKPLRWPTCSIIRHFGLTRRDLKLVNQAFRKDQNKWRNS